MPERQIHMQIDPEFAQLLALYTRTGETVRTALKKGLKTRAMLDGLLDANGKPKRGGGRPARRPQ
ncbi:hypothetical protein AAW14_06225 [Streptomyces hygroscopicus]|uniref:hypothetical protein n=1 Tax=Streptomyces hygroscopicus TaxID=1912 RepID=UPI00223F71F7|nr:hypothetical protein [Streptomyces hygroscopicus]MCW7941638.1 hypothetical protein [Streptomyces hygroscopicus]